MRPSDSKIGPQELSQLSLKFTMSLGDQKFEENSSNSSENFNSFEVVESNMNPNNYLPTTEIKA